SFRTCSIEDCMRSFWAFRNRAKSVWFTNKTLPVVASLTLVAVVTAVLWRIKVSVGISHQFIYFYFFPVMLIRTLFSDLLAALCAVIASVLANFFLQDPLYSFYNTDPLDFGDTVCFLVLSLLGIKCLFNKPLMRQGTNARSVGP